MGFNASISNNNVFSNVSYLHHISNTKLGEFNAFAQAGIGFTKLNDSWESEIRALAGMEFRW